VAQTKVAGSTVQIYANDSLLLGSALTDANGAWSFTPSTSLSGSAAGVVHTITAKDVTANKTSSALSLTIDTSAAAPTISAPSASTSRVAPTLTGTAAEANATIALTAKATDGSTQTFSTTANGSGAWAIDTGSTVGGQTALAANKFWTFTATQTDLAGNTSANSVAQVVNYDSSISTPTITNLADNATTTNKVTLAGSAEASSVWGNVSVRVYDGSTYLGSTTTDYMGGWTFTTAGLSSGSHTLNVEQIDAAGNVSSQASKAITVSTALAAPVLNASTDTGILGDSITSSTAPVLVGQASAGSAVEIWDTVNGVTSRLTTVVANSTGSWSATLSSQAQGAHSYVARQLNSDGTSSTSTATALTIDTTAPSAPSTPVLAAGSDSGASDNITSVNTPTLTGTADANAWVTVLQAGSAIGKVQAGANGAWSFTVPKAVADGSYAFTAKQEDVAGNLSAASSALSVTVDSSVATPVVGVAGAVRYVLIKQTGSGAIALNELEVYANGVNVALGKSVTVGGQVGNWAASGVTGGTYYRDTASAFICQYVNSDNWVQVDLGSAYNIQYLKVYAVSPWETGNLSNVDIFASSAALSGFNYTQLLAGSGGAIKVGGWDATLPNYITTFSAPASVAGPTSQPVISGTGAEAGATITLYDNGSATPLGTATANGSGVWTYQATSITSGTHSITAKQTDVAGNVSNLGSALAFTLGTPPVVIDLNHDGVIGYSQVVMDVDGDGQLDHTAWVGATDGLLVWNPAHDGVVHDRSQYVFATQPGQTDLQGLAQRFDSNHDGVFDATDTAFADFAVWQDANQNGVSDAGEVRSLADWGIASMDLQSDGVNRQPAPGVNEAGRTTASTSDGSSWLVADASFDFTTLTPVAVTSAVAGQVDLASDARANVLRVTLQDVLALPELDVFSASNTTLVSGAGLAAGVGAGVHQLMITGDANDVADIDPSAWTRTDTVVAMGGQTYQAYNATQAAAQLLIDTHIVHAGHVL
jgi:hypothetical protein